MTETETERREAARRRSAAAAKFWRLSEDERAEVIERAYMEKQLNDLTFFEQVAVDEDAGAVVDAWWNSLSPAEREAEIAAFEKWERAESRRRLKT